jgi:hypothetical protein
MAEEIFKTVTRGWRERDERAVWSLSGAGYEQVERFATAHFEHLFQNNDEARFAAEFKYLYAKDWPVKTMTKLLAETLEDAGQRLLNAIRLGQEDGSIRTDLDPELLQAAIFNFNSGMLGRMGELGDKIEGEYGLSLQAIFSQICRIFLDGLQAHPAH